MKKISLALLGGAMLLNSVFGLASPQKTNKQPGVKKPGKVTPPKMVKTKSGLQYQDIKVGKGASPKQGQSVTVHYTGTLTNGKKFDSSRDRGQPFTFVLGVDPVIEGWAEGVSTMKVGGRRKLIVPSALGYKDRDMGIIPPNSTLIFDVELLKIQ